MCEACVETVNNIPMEFLQLMEDRKAEFTALINSLGSDAHKALTIEVMHVDGVTTVSYTHLDVYKRQTQARLYIYI